jgi:methionyl-tRNA formyltransferase
MILSYNQRMKLIYMGSGEFGLPTLKRLHEQHDIVAVVSQPNRPAGRKRKLTATPIAQWAQDPQQNIATFKANDANEAGFVAEIKNLEADACVVIAFGQKLSPELIDASGTLVVNLHASLLPNYRGAAPINWAMINGDAETGVSVIGLAQKMDAGLIFGKATTPIAPYETAGELHDRLSLLGPDLIDDIIAKHLAGTLIGQSQNEAQVTKARKLKKVDGEIDFNQPARDIRCQIHGLTPWPGASTLWQHSSEDKNKTDAHATPLIIRRVRDVHQDEHKHHDANITPGTVLSTGLIATTDGYIELLEVQVPGKRLMTMKEFSQGHALNPGDCFVSP